MSIRSNFFRLAVVSGLAASAPIFASGSGPADQPAGAQAVQAFHDHDRPSPAKLVKIVQDVTRPIFLNPTPATAKGAGYEAFLGCVSGPQEGAMGQHWVNGAFVNDDGKLDPNEPEALLFEISNGRMHLLGVEYIVDAKAWFKYHKDPPVMEGQTFQYVGSPNRFNLEPFFELHVWAWRDNPHGAFVDWNTDVSCEGR